MTQFERMKKGLIYDPGDPEILEAQAVYMRKLRELLLAPGDQKKLQEYMREVFAECGDGCYIELPFYANWGGSHVHFGSGVYCNFNTTFVDDGHIYIGDRVMFGPGVTEATANHPVEPSLRARGLQYNKDVRIGENTWIGAGAVILPGVTIGKDTVIGAGSVVTKDVPDGVVAAGNPCRVLRPVSERDREYFYKDEKIDWENL